MSTSADIQLLEQRMLLSGANFEFNTLSGEFDVVSGLDRASADFAVAEDGTSSAFYTTAGHESTAIRSQSLSADGETGLSIYHTEYFGATVAVTGLAGTINSDGDRITLSAVGNTAGGTYAMYLQATGGNGAPIALTHVPAFSNGDITPSIASRADGETIAVWWKTGGGGGTPEGLYAQRFGANMQRVGDAFQVNTTASGTGVAQSIGFDDAGNFVVVWQSVNGAESVTYAQRYDSDYAKVGDEIVIDTTAGNGDPAVDVAVGSAGNFVVTWQQPNSHGGHDIVAQRFHADGTTDGAEIAIAVGTATLSHELPQVALDDNGSFAVTWRQSALDGTGGDIILRHFGANDMPTGETITVNTTTAGEQTEPRIGVDPEGIFTVSWVSTPSGGGHAVQGRRFQYAAIPPTAGQIFVVDGTSIYRAVADGDEITRTTAATDVNGTYEQFLYGDFNGDGHQDVAGFEDDGTWDVWTGDGSGGLNAQQSWSFWNGAEEWQNVLTGDFNGDGMDDVAARRANGVWQVGLSYGKSFVTRTWGRFGAAVDWSDVMVGDFDGNGRDDVIGRNERGNWYVANSNGAGFDNQFFGRWKKNAGWTDVVVGDFDGNGRDDVSGRTDKGVIWVSTSDGASLSHSVWGHWNPLSGWNSTQVGDFNGDGVDDILSQTATGAWWAGLSDESGFDAHYVARFSPGVGWNADLVVDLDGDGKDDLVRQTATGRWWVSTSTDSGFTTAHSNRWDGMSDPVSYGASQLPQEVV